MHGTHTSPVRTNPETHSHAHVLGVNRLAFEVYCASSGLLVQLTQTPSLVFQKPTSQSIHLAPCKSSSILDWCSFDIYVLQHVEPAVLVDLASLEDLLALASLATWGPCAMHQRAKAAKKFEGLVKLTVCTRLTRYFSRVPVSAQCLPFLQSYFSLPTTYSKSLVQQYRGNTYNYRLCQVSGKTFDLGSDLKQWN